MENLREYLAGVESSLSELTRQIELLESGIEKIHAGRLRNCSPIRGEAKELHEHLIEEINSVLPDNMGRIETEVLEKPRWMMDIEQAGVGDIAEREGRKVIRIDSEVAGIKGVGESYRGTANFNLPDIITPQMWFRNVVSHEYGHIIFDRIPSFRYKRSYQTIEEINLEEGLGRTEGFAFWFGDAISRVRSPVKELARGYERRGANTEIMLVMYAKLTESSRDMGIRKTIENLPKILEKLGIF